MNGLSTKYYYYFPGRNWVPENQRTVLEKINILNPAENHLLGGLNEMVGGVLSLVGIVIIIQAFTFRDVPNCNKDNSCLSVNVVPDTTYILFLPPFPAKQLLRGKLENDNREGKDWSGWQEHSRRPEEDETMVRLDCIIEDPEKETQHTYSFSRPNALKTRPLTLDSRWSSKTFINHKPYGVGQVGFLKFVKKGQQSCYSS